MNEIGSRLKLRFPRRWQAALLLSALFAGVCCGEGAPVAQDPPQQASAPVLTGPPQPDPNWQPKTAAEFVARGFARLNGHNIPQAKADAKEALRLHPNWYLASFLHGRAAYEEQDYAAAIEDFAKVLQQKPDWAQAYHYRGLSYSNQEQQERALPDYQKLLELHPYAANAYNDLGWAYTDLGQFDKAKANFDKAIEIEPDYLRAREHRAILFAKTSDWTAELAELAIILDLAPNDQWAKDAKEAALQKLPPSAEKLARPEMARPDVYPKLVSKVEPQYTDEARRAAVNAAVLCSLVVSPDGVPRDIQVVRGAGFGLDDNAIRAVSAWRFQPATRQGIPVAATANVGCTFRLLVGNHVGQLASLDFNLSSGGSRPELLHGRTPDNPSDLSDASLRMALTVGADGKLKDLSVIETTSPEWAEAAMREMKNWRFRPSVFAGQPAEVKGTFELFHTSNGSLPRAAFNSRNAAGASSAAGPDPNWQPKTADEFLARGYARLKIHKYPQAEADAADALKLRPDAAAACFLHGRAAYESKEYAAAIDDFAKVIQQRPDWPDVYRYRGLAYSNSGQQQSALSDYQKAIELDPNSAPAYNSLGWAYCELGQLEAARTNLDRAIDLDPNFILARENRAKLFGKLQNLQAEQDELAVILGLSPTNQWAKDSQQAILQKLPQSVRP